MIDRSVGRLVSRLLSMSERNGMNEWMDLFIYFGALRGLRRIAESVLLVADSSSLSLN